MLPYHQIPTYNILMWIPIKLTLFSPPIIFVLLLRRYHLTFNTQLVVSSVLVYVLILDLV
jgi:hypothetical protein